MTKIKLTNDQINLLKENGYIVETNTEQRYYHLPQWFHSTGELNVFEIIPENELPEYVALINRKAHREQ